MKKHELAQDLRNRLQRKGLVDRVTLNLVSDDDIIVSYVTCSGCGTRWVSDKQLPGLIAEAQDTEHFFFLCDSYQTGHIH